MYSVQLTGREGGQDFLGDDMATNYVDCFAGKIAVSPQGCQPTVLLTDGDTLELAQVLAAMRIRTIRSLPSANRSVPVTAYQQVGLRGIRLITALKHMADPGVESGPRGASSVEVDAPAESRARPFC